VKKKAKDCEIPSLAPHDLRRTCVRLCHQAGGELEQIQFLLGHVSVQTTERYLGCKQRFRNAVNDRIGLEPDPQGSLECPANSIPVGMRQTGMEGVWNGDGEEAYARADCEYAPAD
jgi:hypothetical protein